MARKGATAPTAPAATGKYATSPTKVIHPWLNAAATPRAASTMEAASARRTRALTRRRNRNHSHWARVSTPVMMFLRTPGFSILPTAARYFCSSPTGDFSGSEGSHQGRVDALFSEIAGYLPFLPRLRRDYEGIGRRRGWGAAPGLTSHLPREPSRRPGCRWCRAAPGR